MAGRRRKPSFLGGIDKAAKAPLRVRPFPELIDEEDWEVKEGRQAYIKRSSDGKAHVMQVPLGETPIDRKIRLHEQAHVTWSEPVHEDDDMFDYVDPDTLNAAEDARIIHLMARESSEWKELNETEVALLTPQMQQAMEDGFSRLSRYLKEGPPKPEKGKKAPPPEKVMHLVEAARLLASTRGYAEGHIFDQIAKSADLDWVRRDVNEMHQRHIASKPTPEFSDSVAFAQEMEDHFWRKQQEIEEAREAMAESGMDERYSGIDLSKPMPKPYTPPTETAGRPAAPAKKDRAGESGRVPERRDDDGYEWGKLKIVHKPLVDKLAAREGRRVRPSDSGAVPRYMHRLVSDQRVFGRRRKKKEFEGTVLIDCSGSMALTPEEVDEILRRWPAVTVATYSGRGGAGELWVIAHKGRRARPDDLKPPYGGNVVDGPCLDWLNKQKGPRVWISDGGVTGAGKGGGNESSGYCFIVDAAKKMKAGKVKRLANVQALLRGQATEENYHGL